MSGMLIYTPTPEIIRQIKKGDYRQFQAELNARDFYKVCCLKCDNNDIDLKFVTNLASALKDTKIKSVNLANKNLGNRAAIFFSTNLKNTKVTNVCFAGNHVGNIGATIAGLNFLDTKVRTLNFQKNNITDIGVNALTFLLRDSKIIDVLMDGNKISEEAYQNLQDAIEGNLSSCDGNKNRLDKILLLDTQLTAQDNRSEISETASTVLDGQPKVLQFGKERYFSNPDFGDYSHDLYDGYDNSLKSEKRCTIL